MAVVSVFVSSTFRDFHGERDVLVGPVRTTLDELVRPFGCRVEVVDLRWGVGAGDPEADDETKQRRVLDVCLSEIARSRPLFVGLVGDRYGWVPPAARAQRVAREAGLHAEVAGRSVTELEFLHGALVQADVVTPVFFFRELTGDVPPGWRDTDTGLLERVAGLRERIANHPATVIHRYAAVADGARVSDLSGFEALAVQVLGPPVVARAQALADERGRMDPVDAVESLFFADRTGVVAGRDELIDQVIARVRARRSVCLHGPSGMGKSALWCTAVQRLRMAGAAVVAVPVGAAPGVTSERVVVSRLAAQLGVAVPAQVSSAEQLRDWWRGLLADAGEVVVAVDSLDALEAGAVRQELGFLTGLPAGVTRLVSTTLDRQAGLLEQIGVERVPVAELAAAAVGQVATELAAAARRELPAGAVQVLTSRPRSPLWLTLAVGELMALDEDDFTAVDPAADPVAELARLVTQTVAGLPAEVGGLVEVVADRAEHRYSTAAVGALTRLLALSRSGLAPTDLTVITGYGDVVVAGVRRAFTGLIEARGAGGRWGFTHGVVQQALGQRYLHDDTERRRQTHAVITNHLATVDDTDPVRQDDLLWHALHSRGNPPAGPFLNEITDPGSPSGLRVQRVVVDALSSEVDIGQATTGADQDGLWVLLATHQTHGPDMGVEQCRRLTAAALMHARRILQANPSSAEAARDVSVSLHHVGEVAREAGQLDRAAEVYEESLQIRRRLLEAKAGGAEADRDLSLSLSNVGDVAREAGQLGRAQQAYEESLQIARRLSQANPGSALAARDLNVSLNRVGDVAREAGQSVRAQQVFEESLQIARRLLEANPGSAQAARDLSVSLSKVGDVAREAGQLDRASEVYEESLQIARRLLQANPGSAQAARDLSAALDPVGDLAAMAGQLDRASELFEESLQIARRLLDADAGSAQAARDLSVSLNNVGDVVREAGQLDRAAEVFEESLQIRRRLLDANPGSAQAARDAAVSLRKVGDVVREAGQLDRAAEVFEESLQIRRRLLDADAGSAQAARDLSVSLDRVGEVAREAGQSVRAQQVFEESLQIARRLLDADAGSAQAARDLSLSLDNVGDVAREAGQLNRASEVYEESLQIARRLLEADAGNAEAARDLSISLNRVGDVASEAGQLDQAADVFEESLQIRRRLSDANPGSAQAARDLTVSLLTCAQASGAARDVSAEGKFVVDAAELLRSTNFPALDHFKDLVSQWLSSLIPQLTNLEPDLAEACTAELHALDGT